MADFIQKHKKVMSLGSGVAFIIHAIYRYKQRGEEVINNVPFSTFLSDLRGGMLMQVLFGTQEMIVSTNNNKQYRTVPIGYNKKQLIDDLVKAGVSFDRLKPTFLKRFKKLLYFIVPFLYLSCVGYLIHRIQNPKDSIGKRVKKMIKGSPQDLINKSSFSNVAGMEETKKELIEIVDFLKNPSKFIQMGCKMPKGILLSGQPGVGKTLLARAIASEANVAFFSASASEFVETLVGRGAKRVRDLFQKAKNENGPCIIFIDEIDCLGKERGGHNSNDEREQTLNQILTELDGFDDNEEYEDDEKGLESRVLSFKPILLIAATNRPNVLDSALLRPGRFDRHISISLPNLSDRLAILKLHAERLARHRPQEKLESSENGVGKLVIIENKSSISGSSRNDVGFDDVLNSIASRTVGFSGADLSNVINEAALLAVRDDSSYVRNEHFEIALEKQLAYSKKKGGN